MASQTLVRRRQPHLPDEAQAVFAYSYCTEFNGKVILPLHYDTRINLQRRSEKMKAATKVMGAEASFMVLGYNDLLGVAEFLFSPQLLSLTCVGNDTD